MLSRELFADALQSAAAASSPLQDRDHAERLSDLCLRLFETDTEVAEEIRRTGGGRPDILQDRAEPQLPDIRVYDVHQRPTPRVGAMPGPLPSTAIAHLAQIRRTAPGDAA